MKQEILEQFREDLKEFHVMTRKFYQKEVTVPEYKSFSGGFGSYAQRGGERSMLRLRLTGGVIEKDTVKFIADSIRKYEIDKVHLTTCETVQLHNLTELSVCGLIEEAFDHGIITRGGGGDFPRNVMCSPLSGVEKEESFDVLPYAREAADYLLSFINRVKLPRKLKVCFSNTRDNEPHATFRDLGFVAKDNQKFDVYAAGGLGNQPKFGVLVVEDLEPSKVLYCIKTMVDVFTKYGNYESRAKSRSRFLQDTLGPEKLKEVFKETLSENLKNEDLEIEITSLSDDCGKGKSAKGDASTFEDNIRVISQKQEGLYAVSYHPAGGILAPEFFEKLYDTIQDMESVQVRLRPNQGMYIINLNADEAKKVLALTADDEGTEFERSTACIGAAICQVGIGNSQDLLERCFKEVKKEHFANGVLPAIHISGCPSSCSAHQTAALGFRGGKKKTDEGLQDAFAVFENGCDKEGQERMGRDVGVMLVDDIPKFLVKLGHAVADKNLTFKEFQKEYPDEILKIAKDFV